ncbi:hypothetical protein IWQ60_011696 [Tieghemiomyces parasiticus]|uniref:Hikeshi-like domain-containing protein n=1 Tax=Tieghemiomyces parasiticus TaxID=78921 RepID=A0A9W7ZI52_9FUNG|nr:hypothetical protein IWQ60_011696 [Tieghemiomyces parasiticus]
MLGILSNSKSSAVFRLRSGSCSSVNGYAGASMMDTNGTIANGASSGTGRPAVLGISIEPIQSVEAQYAQMQQGKAAVPGSLSSNGSSPTASATTALVAKSSTLPSSLAATQLTPATLQQFLVPVVQKVMTNLYNFVTSFSTDRTSSVSAAAQGSQLPFGTAGVSDFSTTTTAAGPFGMPPTASGGGGSGSWATNSGTQGPAIPLKAFEEWYHTFERKVRLDPEFLLRPSNA